MTSRQPPAPVIYVDTCVYFDLLQPNREPHRGTDRQRWESAKIVFDAVNADRVILAASALIEAEVNCLALVRDGAPPVHERVRGWFTAQATRWTDVDRFLARDAAQIARQWHRYAGPGKKLGGADATHIASAVRLGCDYLMTHDEAFPLGHTVNGVQVMRPEEVWPRDLLDELADADAASDFNSE